MCYNTTIQPQQGVRISASWRICKGNLELSVIKHLLGELEDWESSKGPTFLASLEPAELASQESDLQLPGLAQRVITRLTWELEEGIVEMELVGRSRRSLRGPFEDDFRI